MKCSPNLNLKREGFCCILHNFAFRGRPITPPYGPWDHVSALAPASLRSDLFCVGPGHGAGLVGQGPRTRGPFGSPLFSCVSLPSGAPPPPLPRPLHSEHCWADCAQPATNRRGITAVCRGLARPVQSRLATSICRLRHDQTEQGPTEPHAGRGTFLPSSGGAGGGYY